jgi:hypothetical protein
VRAGVQPPAGLLFSLLARIFLRRHASVHAARSSPSIFSCASVGAPGAAGAQFVLISMKSGVLL